MTTPEPAQQHVTVSIDRRREPRDSQPAAVKVEVSHHAGASEFDAVMIDSSSNGLAIRHWRKDLDIGQQVRVSLPSRAHFMAQVVWNWSVGPVVISGLERLLDGATDAFRSRRRIFGIVARSGAQENQPSSATKSRSWIFAGLAALLIAAGWYVTTKLW